MSQRAFLGIILSLLFLVTGCGIESENQEGLYPDFLTNRNWEYNTLSCSEVLHFYEDGTFSYHEACGNPVGDSDCYETYGYDEERAIVTAYGYDDGIEDLEIAILRYTSDSLLVSIEGVIKEFYTYNDVPSINADLHDEVQGYSAYVTIGNIRDNMIEAAPSNVDMDANGRELIREEKLSETALFYRINEKNVHVEGEESDRITTEFVELRREDLAHSEENEMKSGYIWYDDNLEIIKIVYYGLLEIYE